MSSETHDDYLSDMITSTQNESGPGEVTLNTDRTVDVSNVGDGEVVLIAGGGKIYTDIAARFVRSERSLDDILGSPYSKTIVDNIINSGHLAATEFDNFIFGISGYSRVCEVQLVRKRLASYLFKSGRAELKGKRKYEVVLPKGIDTHSTTVALDVTDPITGKLTNVEIVVTTDLLLALTEKWYNAGIDSGKYKEEDLRYMKQQATSTKAIISMNHHGLMDWFKIRTCANAQTEIRDLATKMLKLCKEAAPDLFEHAGPSCKSLGYCPENTYQNERCKNANVYMTKTNALQFLEEKTQEMKLLHAKY